MVKGQFERSSGAFGTNCNVSCIFLKLNEILGGKVQIPSLC